MKNPERIPEKPAKAGREWIRRYRWQGAIVLCVTVIALITSIVYAGNYSTGGSALAAGAPARSITVWSQALDSCRRAITGSTFNMTGPGTNVTQSDLRGTQASVLIIPQGTGYCPYQQGNCVNFANTCLQWHLAVPANGTATYTLKIVTPANGHAGCVGGSVCASSSLQQVNR